MDGVVWWKRQKRKRGCLATLRLMTAVRPMTSFFLMGDTGNVVQAYSLDVYAIHSYFYPWENTFLVGHEANSAIGPAKVCGRTPRGLWRCHNHIQSAPSPPPNLS